MARYIDADELKRRLIDKGFFPAIVARILEDMPSADVVEVKHGEWKSYNTECSICKRINPTLFLDELFGEYKALHLEYCPHCGAKMDGGKGE